MTANEFNTLCNDRLIDPAIALESDAIRKALEERSTNRVIEILDTEF